jgi:signal transduction protein with GAF and PtsI domain
MNIGHAIDAAFSVNSALAMIIAYFRADSGTIHTLGDDNLLHLRAASEGLPPAVLDIIKIIPIGKGMAGLAVSRNEPVTVCNLQTDASGDVRPGAKLTGLEGAIVVPIRDTAGRAIGALGIANRSPRTFTELEIAELHAAAAGLVRRGDW